MVVPEVVIDAMMTQRASEQQEAADEELDAGKDAAKEGDALQVASNAAGDSPVIEKPLGALSEEESPAVKAVADR